MSAPAPATAATPAASDKSAALAKGISDLVVAGTSESFKTIATMLAELTVAVGALDLRLDGLKAVLATPPTAVAKRAVVLAGAAPAAGTSGVATGVKVAPPNAMNYFKAKFAEGGAYRETYATQANLALVESDAKFAKHLGKSDTADYWKAAAGIIWPTLSADQQDKIRADRNVYAEQVQREATAPQLEEEVAA